MEWLLIATPALVAAGSSSTDPSTVLFQYGAIGAVAFLGILFTRAAYRRETERADKLEQEVKRLNQVIQDRYVPALESASTALQESTWILQLYQHGGLTPPQQPPQPPPGGSRRKS